MNEKLIPSKANSRKDTIGTTSAARTRPTKNLSQLSKKVCLNKAKERTMDGTKLINIDANNGIKSTKNPPP